MTNRLFTDDFKTSSYWLENAPLVDLPNHPLPAKADVVIIGSGYTGLAAALQTARGGRHTVVLEANQVGSGCSTRNGGQISTSIKPQFDQLSAKYGADRAFRILKIGHDALAWIEDFVATEQIQCDFKIAGKFTGAHNPAQYEKLGKAVNNPIKGLESDAYLVPRQEQHTELGSDRYFGGVVHPKFASLDPARLHKGLLDRVLRAEASVVAQCPATRIDKEGDLFRVTTPRGSILTRDVIVATNGYTGPTTPWMRRRIIPIGSYVITTEPLPHGQMDQLIPKDRIVGDTRKIVFYYRSSPDRQRVIFGGRVSHAESEPLISGPRLHAHMVEIFPQLAQTRISHTWVGFVGYTFDTLAHLGKHDGIYYAMGYCGSGISMSNYLGMRIGQQVLGRKEGATALDGLGFQTRPLYTGSPWFLAASVMYYGWLDKLNR